MNEKKNTCISGPAYRPTLPACLPVLSRAGLFFCFVFFFFFLFFFMFLYRLPLCIYLTESRPCSKGVKQRLTLPAGRLWDESITWRRLVPKPLLRSLSSVIFCLAHFAYHVESFCLINPMIFAAIFLSWCLSEILPTLTGPTLWTAHFQTPTFFDDIREFENCSVAIIHQNSVTIQPRISLQASEVGRNIPISQQVCRDISEQPPPSRPYLSYPARRRGRRPGFFFGVTG